MKAVYFWVFDIRSYKITGIPLSYARSTALEMALN